MCLKILRRLYKLNGSSDPNTTGIQLEKEVVDLIINIWTQFRLDYREHKELE